MSNPLKPMRTEKVNNPAWTKTALGIQIILLIIAVMLAIKENL